jgi:hypothetical protein
MLGRVSPLELASQRGKKALMAHRLVVALMGGCLQQVAPVRVSPRAVSPVRPDHLRHPLVKLAQEPQSVLAFPLAMTVRHQVHVQCPSAAAMAVTSRQGRRARLTWVTAQAKLASRLEQHQAASCAEAAHLRPQSVHAMLAKVLPLELEARLAH